MKILRDVEEALKKTEKERERIVGLALSGKISREAATINIIHIDSLILIARLAMMICQILKDREGL